MLDAPKMTRQHFNFIADLIGPITYPTELARIADQLAATNPRFDREKFLDRAIKNYEANNVPADLDDHIPY